MMHRIKGSPTDSIRAIFMMGGASLLVLIAAGCASKNYVRNQTAPVVQRTNELEDQTAANHRKLQDVDKRATQGIQQVQTAANSADQKAVAAGQSATQAQQSAQEALHHADSLASVVSNLDTYHQVGTAEVHFAFDSDVLSRKEKQQLDSFGQQLSSAKSYILEITGGTDSTGNKEYNYELSERRAENVAQYLATKFNVPPHKFYLIGIGKDQAVASNSSAKGRAKNRRVDIQLLSNAPDTGNANGTQQQGAAPAAGEPNTAPATGAANTNGGQPQNQGGQPQQ